jgi:xylulokinase
VTAEAAEETGLPVGIPVAVGGHDHLCGALAAGAVSPGEIVDSIGTAESVLLPTARYRDDLALGRGRICCYAYVVPDLFVVQGGMALSGGALAWVAGNLFADAADPVAAALAAAESAPVGSGGLLYYPYLGGNGAPVGDENLAASFVGLRPEHGRAHLVRAALEGTSFGVRDILDTFDAVIGEGATAIRVVGGGARSPLWLRIRASVLNRPVEAVDVPEAVAVGAALLAGVGAGIFADAAAAVAAIRREVTTYLPDPAAQARYDRLYREGYRRLYPSLEPVLAALSSIHREWTSGQ